MNKVRFTETVLRDASQSLVATRLAFDQFQHGYYAMGGQVGKAWNAGAKLMKQ